MLREDKCFQVSLCYFLEGSFVVVTFRLYCCEKASLYKKYSTVSCGNEAKEYVTVFSKTEINDNR